jgi:CheY-like chemotaxis protein
METPIKFPYECLKVLVVEDDVISRMLLNEIFKECNVTAIFARNGKDAVIKVKADDSFDLILMDIKMPIMNGFEATESIRNLGFTNPIIAQTAFASEEDKARVKSSGFSAYILKPIKKSKLLEVINETCGINL